MATPKKTYRLQPLRGSNFELDKNQPDIRGWDVRDEQGRKVGDVQELIFDAEAKKVRYLVLDVNDSRELELDKRTVLVPIGLAQLHAHDNDVVLQGINPFQLRALPSFRKEDLGVKAEMAIATVFGRQYTSRPEMEAGNQMHNDFYEHDHFNDRLMNKRSGDVGGNAYHNEQADAIRRQQLSDAEAASLRRDAELGKPISNLETGTGYNQQMSREEEQRELERRRRNQGY